MGRESGECRMNIASGTETGGRSDGGLCIADFFRDVGAAARDVIGLQVVTTGRRASEAAREWFADNRYQDYLYLHGLSVEMAEALAEYLHRCIRGELGFAAEEARDTEAVLNQGYRGSRYSFGYPACPNLADQRQLLALLKAAEIGIAFSEEDQLDPEQLTSADHRGRGHDAMNTTENVLTMVNPKRSSASRAAQAVRRTS